MRFGLPELLVTLIMGVWVIAGFWSTCRIVRRMGFSPLWGLLWFAPAINVLVFVWLARNKWPVEAR